MDRDDLERVEAPLRPFTQRLTTALLGSWNARVAQGEAVEAVATDAAVELTS